MTFTMLIVHQTKPVKRWQVCKIGNFDECRADQLEARQQGVSSTIEVYKPEWKLWDIVENV